MVSSSSLHQWHRYIGLFIAPSVLFFALTGAIQLFNLHETHGRYRPAAIVEMLSAVHKDQVFEQPGKHRAHNEEPESALHAGSSSAEEPPSHDADKVSPTTFALKCFFLVVALGLIVSTCIGVWMGMTQLRRKALGWSLFTAGALIPLCLLAI